MAIAFLFDHNVKLTVPEGLRQRGVAVQVAFEESLHKLEDNDLLDEAERRNRVLFTHDDDLLKIAAGHMRFRYFFRGVVYVHQTKMTIGEIIDDLELLAAASEPAELENEVVFLPL